MTNNVAALSEYSGFTSDIFSMQFSNVLIASSDCCLSASIKMVMVVKPVLPEADKFKPSASLGKLLKVPKAVQVTA